MIILGLDPGTANPGLAIVERDRVGWRLVNNPVLHGLDELNDALANLGHVDCCSIESVAWSLHAKRQGYGSGRILESVGAVRAFAMQRRIPCVTVDPKSWRKHVTGSGRATKEQAREALRRFVRGMPKRLSTNRSDAIAVAIAGACLPGGQQR